jgi:hypothetical protein
MPKDKSNNKNSVADSDPSDPYFLGLADPDPDPSVSYQK